MIRKLVSSIITPRLLVLLTVAVLLCTMTPGCKTGGDMPAGTARAVQEMTADATVTAVDQEKRVVSLKRADGSVFTVVARDVVRNLPQVDVGDTVTVTYAAAIVASLKKPGEVVAPPSAKVGLAGVKEGEKPAGIIGGQVSVTVRIESVDTERNIVVFTRPGSGLRAIPVQKPEFQEYIKSLKPGDNVEITYTEAVAVQVTETPAEKK